MSENTAQSLIEEVAEQLIMADIEDLPSLARISQQLQATAEAIEPENHPEAEMCKAAAAKASKLVESIILKETEDVENSFRLVNAVICSLQTAVCQGKNAVFPGELQLEAKRTTIQNKQNAEAPGVQDSNAKTKNKNETATAAIGNTSDSDSTPGDAAPASIIDPELLNAFIDQQRSVLPEIDDAILAFENTSAIDHINTIRRIIHTMKGEAGVCGITDIETLCHKLEDYLETENSGQNNQTCDEITGSITGPAVSADILFEVKDWLEKAIDAYNNDARPSGLEAIIQTLENRCSSNSPDKNQENTNISSAQTKTEETISNQPGGNQKTQKTETATSMPEEPLPSVPIADPDLTADFVTEAQEHFDIADENLLHLENDPKDSDAVNAVFRAFHTIKGVCGFIGLAPIGEIAHKAENLLDDVRKDKREFQGNIVDLTFKSLDMLKNMIQDLTTALNEGTNFTTRPEFQPLLRELDQILHQQVSATSSDKTKKAAAPQAANTVTGEDADTTNKHRDPETKSGADAGPKSSAPQQQKTESPQTQPTSKAGVRATMKVDAEKIDLLLDTIGELVIAESMVSNNKEIIGLNSLKLEKQLSQLSKITHQLQDLGMSMRLIPVAGVFKKMARLVRDLSHKSGKKIAFSMEGEDTEIDKAMVDKLGDPMVHMIRNSVDHGIENNSQDRVANGKSEEGHIKLRAFHQGGCIHIQIIDDGKGLDRSAIVKKAISSGLITDDHGMSDEEIFSLIFEAGFSTAKQITEVSGRGVGMDVVRRNIEALKGKILIDSKKGEGSTFTLVLPLTTAIIDGMLTRVGNETYIIPTLSIIESIRPEASMISEVVGRGEVLQFRGHLLPVFRLNRLFNTEEAENDPTKALLVIVEDGGKQVALMIDELIGQQQTVIKTLGAAMGRIQGVSGVSILADGRPGLILDVAGIVRMAIERKEAGK